MPYEADESVRGVCLDVYEVLQCRVLDILKQLPYHYAGS